MSETLPPVRSTNNWAVISLVLSIVAFPVTCCGIVFPPAGCVAFIPAILAVVLGFIARREIRESGGAQTGDGLALTGIVLGAVLIVVLVLFSCLVVLGLSLLDEGIEDIFDNISATLEAQQ